MREVVPIWQNMSVAIYKDKEANKVSQGLQQLVSYIGLLHFCCVPSSLRVDGQERLPATASTLLGGHLPTHCNNLLTGAESAVLLSQCAWHTVAQGDHQLHTMLPSSTACSVCSQPCLSPSMSVLLPLQKWGWVQEMYAFTISLYVIGVRHVDLILHMMAQPPWDNRMTLGVGRPYYILHYTYGNDFTADGKHTPGGLYWFFLAHCHVQP